MNIKPIDYENLVSVSLCCLNDKLLQNPLIQKGVELKQNWIKTQLDRFGEIGYVATTNEKEETIGFIQFLPDPTKQLLFIQCIFIPDEKYRGKGVGKRLVQRLIEDSKKEKTYFDNNIPNALVTYAFEVPEFYPQDKFFRKMEFIEFDRKDPYWLYYPIKEKFRVKASDYQFFPQHEDKSKALVLFDTSCPFCVAFKEKYEELLKTVHKELDIKILDVLKEPHEIALRGKVPLCSVYGEEVKAFVLEEETFKDEVKKILNRKNSSR